MKFLAIFVACFVVVFGEQARYDNYRLYSVKVEDQIQLKALHDLEHFGDGISFMELPTSVNQIAKIIVPPHKLAFFSEFLESYGMKGQVTSQNLQTLIDNEQPQVMSDTGYGWKQYYNLEKIYAWLDQLLEQYPKLLTNVEYGKSYEGRKLRAVKLAHKKENPTIFIESTIHAREWVTVATATYFLNELLTSNDTEIRNLAENYNWIFVPVTNVDGYAYTHKGDRMWRKTRKPNPTVKICKGADPNRNWDFHHAEQGASTLPCSETYAGPTPFSEPETLALSEYIKKVENLKLYISFHSFSQLLLFPYGHTNEHAPNHDDMMDIARATKKSISQRYGTDYTVGNIAETIYLASGSSIDWVYGKVKTPLTFTFEFRDTGEHGFLLPADQIIPNSLEVIDGLITLVNEAKSLKYF